MTSTNPVKVVTLSGECFAVAFQREADVPPASLYHFHVTDLAKKRGTLLVSVLSDWTLQVQVSEYANLIQIASLNKIRSAFDSGQLTFGSPSDGEHYQQLSLDIADLRSPRLRQTMKFEVS